MCASRFSKCQRLHDDFASSRFFPGLGRWLRSTVLAMQHRSEYDLPHSCQIDRCGACACHPVLGSTDRRVSVLHWPARVACLVSSISVRDFIPKNQGAWLPHLRMSSRLHAPKEKERKLVPACTGHGPLELSLVPALADMLSPLEEALWPFAPSGQVWASTIICTGIGVCGYWMGSTGDKPLGLRVGESPVYKKKLQGLCPSRLLVTSLQAAFLLGHAGPQTSILCTFVLIQIPFSSPLLSPSQLLPVSALSLLRQAIDFSPLPLFHFVVNQFSCWVIIIGTCVRLPSGL